MDAEYLQPARNLRLTSGEDYSLEEKAAAILATSRRGVTALSDKRDYLTRDQLKLRERCEIPNSTGVSDESLMSGLFRRSYNPLAGTRPTRHYRHHDD